MKGSKSYKELLTPEILKKMFSYNPNTGSLMKKYLASDDRDLIELYGSSKAINIRNSLLCNHGAERTNAAGNKYLTFRIQANNCKWGIDVHRICWVITYGYWPREIDHRDGDGLNNKISNLREVTRTENSKNHRKARNNKSGICGVNFRKDIQKWRAFCFESVPRRKQISLGVFDTLLDAACARKSYERRNGFTERHGR